MALSLIIDGTNHIHMDWFARKDCKAALATFTDRMVRFQEFLRPDRFVVCMDAEHTFRKELYASYKAGRSVKEPGLVRALATAPEQLAMQVSTASRSRVLRPMICSRPLLLRTRSERAGA